MMEGFEFSRQTQVDIWHQVPLVPQLTGMSCWAAAAAMLLGWRECLHVCPEEIARGGGFWAAYREGLDPASIVSLSQYWYLYPIEQASLSAQSLYQLLFRYGPLWVGEASPGLHSVVITGIYGDGSDQGSYLRINDPWPLCLGERYSKKLSYFKRDFRAATEAVGEHIQVLHSGGRNAGSSYDPHFHYSLQTQNHFKRCESGHKLAATESKYGEHSLVGTENLNKVTSDKKVANHQVPSGHCCYHYHNHNHNDRSCLREKLYIIWSALDTSNPISCYFLESEHLQNETLSTVNSVKYKWLARVSNILCSNLGDNCVIVVPEHSLLKNNCAVDEEALLFNFHKLMDWAFHHLRLASELNWPQIQQLKLLQLQMAQNQTPRKILIRDLCA